MLLPCTAGLLFTALPVRADRIFSFGGAGSVPRATNIEQDDTIVARLFESIEAAGEDDSPAHDGLLNSPDRNSPNSHWIDPGGPAVANTGTSGCGTTLRPDVFAQKSRARKDGSIERGKLSAAKV